MRLFPDSIAGRTSWLLVAGLIVTVAASLAVFMLDLSHSVGWNETLSVMNRTAMVASVMDRVPAEQRVSAAPALSQPGIAVRWTPDANPPAMSEDFMTRHLARDLGIALEPYGLAPVETGYGAPEHNATWLSPGPVQAWIGLSDGTWLAVTVDSERIGALWTGRLVLAFAVLAAGAGLLAARAARKVTAPLDRFAAAAQRLGTDVDAPPMDQSGPREIRQAAAAFNRMQDRIRRLIEARTLMLAALSHDLRTALTRLQMRTDFIADRRQRDKALADLDRMQAMLDSTLAFARDEVSAEPVRRIDLAALLQSLCDDLSDAGQSIRFEGPVHLIHDGRPVALRRAFANLLENALVYGHEAHVTLVEHGAAVEASIADRGPGIPEALREQVFAPFFRLEPSRNRETGGTGLGLTIARSVIQRHGGAIVLAARRGGGLRVRITLPRVHGA